MADTGVPTVSLNLIQTLGVGAVVYYSGVLLKRRLLILDRLNIPAAVVGGLLFAMLVLGARDRLLNLQLETSAQSLFMVAFFTTIGMNASVPLLKAGGRGVVVFLLLSGLFCFVQNFVGMGIAGLYGVHPLLGVMAGSVTLVGGPATGLAFSNLFREAGLTGADTIAITSATFGIVCGGLAGGPVATWLIARHRLVARPPGAVPPLSGSRGKTNPAKNISMKACAWVAPCVRRSARRKPSLRPMTTTNKVTNILTVGVGGQGVILASDIIAAVMMRAGHDVKKSEVHGMAQRGGSVTSHVRFGPKVYSPIIRKGAADILFSFELLETLRYLDFLHNDSVILVNDQKILPPSVTMGKDVYPSDIPGRLKEPRCRSYCSVAK